MRDFHDAIVVRAEWIGRDIVDERRYLLFGGLGTLLLQIQSQFADVFPAELIFREVKRFAYSDSMDAAPDIQVTKEGVSVEMLAWTIDCTSLGYRRCFVADEDFGLATE